MPGITYAGRLGGIADVPFTDYKLLGKSMTGTGTPPAATLKVGDIVALSSKSTVGGASDGDLNVLRMLLAADKTANYAGATVAVPAAPVVTAGTATSLGVPFLANGAYSVALTAIDSRGGETTIGTAAAPVSTAAGTQALQVAPPTLPTGAVGYRVYCSAVGTTTPFFLVSGIISAAQGFNIGGYGGANALVVTGGSPPTANTTGGNAGIYGVWESGDVDTNSSGLITATPSTGGVIFGSPNYSAGLTIDRDSTRVNGRVIVATPDTIFRGKLNSGTASSALVGEACGLTLATSSGVTTYTINQTAPLIGNITGYDQNDNTFVFFTVQPAYCQVLTGIVYTAQ